MTVGFDAMKEIAAIAAVTGDRRDGGRDRGRDGSRDGGSNNFYPQTSSETKSTESLRQRIVHNFDYRDKKSYRALTATERLPKDLPEWFARNDANADGQVAMAEFSASWSNSTADEFAQFDLNRDGSDHRQGMPASDRQRNGPRWFVQFQQRW